MATKNTMNPGFAAAWQLFSPRVAPGTSLGGSTTMVATMGNRTNTESGTSAIGMAQLLGAGLVSERTSVPAGGAIGGLRHESELALDRGKFTGGFEDASHETPRLYGASGECPRKIPA
ncbi:hypothetical protein GCM10007079_12580 [Nocardiopsis terrae]|uniref:Uncharacterized protein n=1 Tax=Nocardiopsis terrae TaxID=372655 RepID=A0ABR9HBY5_9ACTN|nr:hypothetical protein [Nocardiopsis terrae]MBE1456534.1 hypothetical protein [Nocardiopsis terrae]GHC76342.1 hypothetical protein GCM10007079_12580 [Nocardiopsis terrae]